MSHCEEDDVREVVGSNSFEGFVLLQTDFEQSCVLHRQSCCLLRLFVAVNFSLEVVVTISQWLYAELSVG